MDDRFGAIIYDTTDPVNIALMEYCNTTGINGHNNGLKNVSRVFASGGFLYISESPKGLVVTTGEAPFNAIHDHMTMNYRAKLAVRDQQGNTSYAYRDVWEISYNDPPTLLFVDAVGGTAPGSVEVTATATDPNLGTTWGGGMLEYRWDIDNDGVWDTDFSYLHQNISVLIEPDTNAVSIACEVKDRFHGRDTVLTYYCEPTGIPDNNCNGIDDNCSGTPDDGYLPTVTNCGVGACSSTGELSCQSGFLGDTCTPYLPQTEICGNGIDEDCDGADEECPVLDSDGDGIPDNEDSCPNEDATGFDVDNDGCIDSFAGLTDLVGRLVLEGVISTQLENSLLSKISSAMNSNDRENICTAVNVLGALKNQIEAQRGKKVSGAAADEVVIYTDSLIDYLESLLPPGESC